MNQPRYSQFGQVCEESPELLTESIRYPRYTSPTLSSRVLENIRTDEPGELPYDPRVECRLFNDPEEILLLQCREC